MKKKILVKLPSDNEKIILSFAFLTELHNLFQEEEIHLVIDEEKSEILKFLSKKFIIHNLPKDKRSLIGVHHFVVNLTDVFNVEVFFDLDESFKSAFLGFNFRSKERYGFENGLNKIFYNKSVLVDKNACFDLRTFELLKKKTGKDYEIKKYSPDEYIKTVEQIEKRNGESNPDFLLCVMNGKKVLEHIELFDFICNKLEGNRMRISFWNEDDDKMAFNSEIIKQIESWPLKKPIERIVYGEYGLFIRNLYLCKGVLTDIPWIGLLAGYFGVSAFVLRKDLESEFVPILCQTFRANPITLVKNKNDLKMYENNESKIVREAEFMDIFHARFNL